MNNEIKGIGFIKSRKSEESVIAIAEHMDTFAREKMQVELMGIIVDQSAGQDIDRISIDELMSWMEKDKVKAVFVRSIGEITNDAADLCKFLQLAQDLDVVIYDMEAGVIRTVGPALADPLV